MEQDPSGPTTVVAATPPAVRDSCDVEGRNAVHKGLVEQIVALCEITGFNASLVLTHGTRAGFADGAIARTRCSRRWPSAS